MNLLVWLTGTTALRASAMKDTAGATSDSPPMERAAASTAAGNVRANGETAAVRMADAARGRPFAAAKIVRAATAKAKNRLPMAKNSLNTASRERIKIYTCLGYFLFDFFFNSVVCSHVGSLCK